MTTTGFAGWLIQVCRAQGDGSIVIEIPETLVSQKVGCLNYMMILDKGFEAAMSASPGQADAPVTTPKLSRLPRVQGPNIWPS